MQTDSPSGGTKRAARSIVQAVAALVTIMLSPEPRAAAQEHGGVHGHRHAELHHWYKTLRQPGTGYGCCDNKDCRPTTARVRDGSIEVLVDGEWTRVPRNTILDVKSPDLSTHVCAPKGGWSPKPIFCVVLGFGV
jgi:hypothetical protein